MDDNIANKSNRGTKKGRRGKGITSTRTDDKEVFSKKREMGLAIRERMKEEKITYRKLEEITSVYASQLTQMTNGKGNYVIENFLRVIDALDLKLVLVEKDERKKERKEKETKLDLIISMLEEMNDKS